MSYNVYSTPESETAIPPSRKRDGPLAGFLWSSAAIDWLTRKGLAALDADYLAPLRKFVDPGPMPPAEPADQADPEGPS